MSFWEGKTHYEVVDNIKGWVHARFFELDKARKIRDAIIKEGNLKKGDVYIYKIWSKKEPTQYDQRKSYGEIVE